MKKSLLISFLFAVIGLALGHVYLERLKAEVSGGPRVAVLVASEDVPMGAPLSEKVLAVREIPQAYVESRHVRASDLKQILGARTSAALKANETVLWTDLASYTERARMLSGLVQNGMRAVAIEGGSSAFDGLVQPGDHVDVLLTTTAADEPNGLTITLLQNLLVLSVGGTLGHDESASGKATPPRHDGSVSLSVTAEQAQILTQAKERGKLSLTVRNPEDLAIVEGMPETAAKDVVAAKDRVTWRRAPGRTEERIEHVR